MGVKIAVAAALCALCAAPTALTQKSIADGLRDCERLAAINFKQENAAFKRFKIDLADVNEDKFTDKIGTQFVSTVYHGKAVYQSGGEPDNVRFIYLHGGVGKGAVFVYTLPR